MKKVMYSQYGGSEVLQLVEVPQPVAGPNELLVRVHAVALNPLDWKIRAGEMKLVAGSKLPKGVGIDFAGTVERVGAAVHTYQPGQEVFGLLDPLKGEALAEYVVVREQQVARKPVGLSFAQAAALPVVGSSALQVFEQLIALRPGTELLINGASGGIGMVATQLAKRQGARVTAVVGPAGLAAARQWGADTVLNYREQSVHSLGQHFDAVLDLSGQLPFAQARTLLTPAGVYVHSAPGAKEILGSFWHNLFSKQKYRVLLLKPKAAYLTTLANSNLDVVIGATYPLAAFQQAYAEVAKGGIVGKAVFTLD
jgi:NADPH:quinone reductase-like Zn-dependent oxidoreductase